MEEQGKSSDPVFLIQFPPSKEDEINYPFLDSCFGILADGNIHPYFRQVCLYFNFLKAAEQALKELQEERDQETERNGGNMTLQMITLDERIAKVNENHANVLKFFENVKNGLLPYLFHEVGIGRKYGSTVSPDPEA